MGPPTNSRILPLPQIIVAEPQITFVFETTEVKKTGRTARRKSGMTGKDLIMFEITPIDPEGIQWKKWVPEDQLFTIDT